MTEETIEILVRAKIQYDESKAGARQYVAEQAAQLLGSGRLGGAHVAFGAYNVDCLPGGEVISPRPVTPPDIMLVPRLRADAAKQRAAAPCVHYNAELIEEAIAALANASGEKCDIAEYHIRRLFKLREYAAALEQALDTAAPGAVDQIKERLKNKERATQEGER
jgi:hypothetical protein